MLYIGKLRGSRIKVTSNFMCSFRNVLWDFSREIRGLTYEINDQLRPYLQIPLVEFDEDTIDEVNFDPLTQSIIDDLLQQDNDGNETPRMGDSEEDEEDPIMYVEGVKDRYNLDYLILGIDKLYKFEILLWTVMENPELNNVFISNLILKLAQEIKICFYMGYIDTGVLYEICDDYLKGNLTLEDATFSPQTYSLGNRSVSLHRRKQKTLKEQISESIKERKQLEAETLEAIEREIPKPPAPLDPYLYNDKPEDEARWWDWVFYPSNWGDSSDEVKNKKKNKRIDNARKQKKKEWEEWKEDAKEGMERAAVLTNEKNNVNKAAKKYARRKQSGDVYANAALKSDLHNAADELEFKSSDWWKEVPGSPPIVSIFY